MYVVNILEAFTAHLSTFLKCSDDGGKGFSCSCTVGFSGPTCEDVANPCLHPDICGPADRFLCTPTYFQIGSDDGQQTRKQSQSPSDEKNPYTCSCQPGYAGYTA